MKLLETILVAVDFHESTDAIVDEAILLAKTFGSKVVLMHSVPDFDLPEETENLLLNGAESRLQNIKGTMEGKGIVVEKTILIQGIPYVTIIDQSDIEDVNVIVIGSGDNTTGSYNTAIGVSFYKYSNFMDFLLIIFPFVFPFRHRRDNKNVLFF